MLPSPSATLAPDMSKTESTDLLKRGRTGFETGVEVLRAHLKTMTSQPGVYRMMTQDSSVLYVGKAKNLKKRVSSYTQRARLPLRLQRMVAQVRQVEIAVTHTEAEALLLEANLIRRYMPPFNVLLRDDKSYPYILIARDHDFPQLIKHRGSKGRKGWYFGPFASAGAVGETITLLQKGFMLRNCADGVFANRTRPCLQYHIKRCTAPCVGMVSKEQYAKQVDEARDFLKGRNQDIQQTLAGEMQKASDAMEYERAAKLRDRIKALTTVQSRQGINVAGMDDADVFALHQKGGRTAVQVFFFRDDRNYGTRTYFPIHDREATTGEILAAFLAQFYTDKEPPPSLVLSHAPDEQALLEQALSEVAGHKVAITVPKHGDKKRIVDHALQNAEEALAQKISANVEQVKLLERVGEIFGMVEPPKRIEVYDNSHISGKHAVGAMIAAGAEGFLKKTYRKFNIKDAKAAGDDYAMMDEVMRRRFERLMEEDPERQSGMWPDLVLVDGGQGQLSRVLSVIADLGIDGVTFVGIAKGPDRNAGRERYFMEGREAFSLQHDDPAHYYMQRLRDEAHRFAIGTHRAKRAKAIGSTGLDDVPGIGAARKKALLHHFGSAKAASGAGVDDLAAVPGISRAMAKKIHDYFREQG